MKRLLQILSNLLTRKPRAIGNWYSTPSYDIRENFEPCSSNQEFAWNEKVKPPYQRTRRHGN